VLRIDLFGPPRIEVDGHPLVVDTRKAIALLAYVAVVRRPVARDSLAELLWPEADPADGRGALRRTLSTLRAGLGGAWLDVDRRQVSLGHDHGQVDVTSFRVGAASGDRASVAAAIALYRGDFLEGFALRDSAPFDEWQLLEAEALRAELADALRRLVALESADGRLEQAVGVARRLLALDRLDEGAHRSLMQLHAARGDRSAIDRQYREVVRVLDAELGVTPSPETTDLHDLLLSSATPTIAARAPDVPALDDLSLELLEACAVLGDEIDPDMARDVSGRSDAEATAGLDGLVGLGLLREPRPGERADRFRFVDGVRRATVLEGLGVSRRRWLTRRAADAHRRAGHAARAAGSHALAAGHYRAAISLGVDPEVALHEALGDVETLEGRYGEALAAYEYGAAHAGPDRLAQLEHRLGSLHLRRGAFELADLHLAAALVRLDAAPSALRARVLADRSLVAVRRKDPAAAERLARMSLREARRIEDPEAQSQAENLLALLARRSGDIEAARRHLRRSLDLAASVRNAAARVAALNNLALLDRAVGDLESALALTDEALRGCLILGDRHREAALRNNRADLLQALGRRAEAEDELRRSVSAFAAVGETGLEPEIWKLVDW
jgi:DNA-binding SARP family transcriptional activator